MNLLDLQRMGIENGELDASEIDSYSGKNVLLNFVKTDLGLRAKYNNVGVFPRLDFAGMSEGTWICTLERMKDAYRATPIRKIDASFFLELKRSKKDEIIDALWEGHKEELLPELKELYLQTLQEDIEKAVAEATASLTKTIADLKEEKAELEKTVEANNVIISNMGRVQTPVAEENKEPEGMIMSSRIVVKRVSPDMISSPFFTGHKYFVHVSYDLKTLVIQPHDYGTVICINNVLLLSGLGNISSFSGETELPSEYVPEKGLVVHL